jgi:hypothetical protein
MRPDEMRVVIRSSTDEPAFRSRPIPARIFKDSVTTILAALKAADAEMHSRKHRSEFFVSHLEMGSNVFGVFEQRRSGSDSLSPSIDLFKKSAFSVYRSEYVRVQEAKRIAESIIRLGRVLDPEYPQEAIFPSDALPLDSFFRRQTDRLKQALSHAQAPARFFAGNVISSFDGRLGSIDYRGAVWKGCLVLPGAGAQIECVFNRDKGENAFNPYGNKRVSVTGRAIYTGDSYLPERIEVTSITEFGLAEQAIDVRGSLVNAEYRVGWVREGQNFQ